MLKFHLALRLTTTAFPVVFAIDICAYAVMSNHYHLVLHVNRKQALAWSLDDVIHTWHRLFSGNLFSQRYCRGDRLLQSEMASLKDTAETWRKRLMDISWFMRVLNESVARQANAEDHCSGRFWAPVFAPAKPAYHTSCI